MDELLVKYLLGEATEEERQAVVVWINADEDNKRYFEHFKMIWEESKALLSHSQVDEHSAWLRFKERTGNEEGNNVIAFTPQKKNRFSWKAAASVAVMILGAWAAYYFVAGNNTITVASGVNVLIDTLPDGSVVTLNRNSSISYPKKFKEDSRLVALKGEAFFNVTPDKKRPFEISVDDVKVRVLGTSFNIKNTGEKTEVIVETGIVRVSQKKNAVQLLPRQKAVVVKKGKGPVIEKNNDDLYNYYRTKEFVCNNTPLWKLVDALNSAYNVEIVIESKRVRNLPLTTTFKDSSLDSILKIVVETFNLNIEQKDGKIILK
jgi:transmembrane sensor